MTGSVLLETPTSCVILLSKEPCSVDEANVVGGGWRAYHFE